MTTPNDGRLTIGQIRLRCYCDPDTACWHFRTAGGKSMRRDGKRQAIWVTGRGAVPITRAAWEARHQKPVPEGWIAFRTCKSYDCANPAHIKAAPRKVMGDLYARRGDFKGQGLRIVANRRNASRKMIVPPELRAWIVESSQTHAAIAHGMGCSECLVRRVRKAAKNRLTLCAPSIFAIGVAAANAGMRAA